MTHDEDALNIETFRHVQLVIIYMNMNINMNVVYYFKVYA